MPDPSQLPHLIRLLEDDSPMVQEAVWDELHTFGPGLEQTLANMNLHLREDHLDRWREFEGRNFRYALRALWPSWTELENEKEQLERGLTLLSDFQSNYADPGRLPKLLHELAHQFCEQEEFSSSENLARFLFETENFTGGQVETYQSENRDLANVIQNRSGDAFSLTCIYMLIGHRVGIDIQGCNFPGHFMGRTLIGNEVVLVDCYNGGRLLKARAFHDLSPNSVPTVREVVHRPASIESILSHVLNDLVRAYDATNRLDDSLLMRELLKMQRSAHEMNRPHR